MPTRNAARPSPFDLGRDAVLDSRNRAGQLLVGLKESANGLEDLEARRCTNVTRAVRCLKDTLATIAGGPSAQARVEDMVMATPEATAHRRVAILALKARPSVRRLQIGSMRTIPVSSACSNGGADSFSRGQYSDAVLNELESQNDQQVEGIMGKVKVLKDVSAPTPIFEGKKS